MKTLKETISAQLQEFDELTNLDNYQGDFKKLQEESLFNDTKHPESDFELDEQKIKQWHTKSIQEVIDKVVEMADKILDIYSLNESGSPLYQDLEDLKQQLIKD